MELKLKKFQNISRVVLILKSLTLKESEAMKIRSLILFDLQNIIVESNNLVFKAMVEWGISNKTDLSNLFTYYCICKILTIYKSHKGGFICFYFSQEKYNELIDGKYDINYKRFFKIITKTIKFPIVVSTLPYQSFLILMMSDCPEYDEILDNNKMFSEIVPDLIKVIKKLKFYKLENEFVNDIKEQIKCISIF